MTAAAGVGCWEEGVRSKGMWVPRLQKLGKARERFSPDLREEPPRHRDLVPSTRRGSGDPLAAGVTRDANTRIPAWLGGRWGLPSVGGERLLSVALFTSVQSPSGPQRVFLGQLSINSPLPAWAAGQMTPLPQHPAAAMRGLCGPLKDPIEWQSLTRSLCSELCVTGLGEGLPILPRARAHSKATWLQLGLCA